MEVFAKDFIMGEFNISDYGLILSSFSYGGESEDELGMKVSPIEEFVGHHPVPVYLGHKYEDKLCLQVTLTKNPCIWNNNMYFTEKECRSILRVITGHKSYQWTKIASYNFDEDLWYRTKVINVSYQRINGHVAGIILNLECDSQFAWSQENNIIIRATANQPFFVFNNTDDLHNYVFPIVTITSSTSGTIEIINQTDNNWATELNNVASNEVITMNSKTGILSSSTQRSLLLDNFNLGWIRLVPNKNVFVSNKNITITFKYRVPRKVGVV